MFKANKAKGLFDPSRGRTISKLNNSINFETSGIIQKHNIYLRPELGVASR
ncbi:MAG: hypothetical protein HC830_03810 [Bacteroidetes bacterium]|nr:hypothetical protein [Bacteroidota bacterium]